MNSVYLKGTYTDSIDSDTSMTKINNLNHWRSKLGLAVKFKLNLYSLDLYCYSRVFVN